MQTIKIKLLSPASRMPERKTGYAACYDVYIPGDVVINPGRNIVPMGFAIELPVDCYAEIRPRSGFSAKGMSSADNNRHDADVLHGVIDADYRGEVGVIVKSYEQQPFTVRQGERIAQMLIARYANDCSLTPATELSSTDRGEGGFGHTNEQE